MKPDPQSILLTVIAAALVSISVKLWFFAPPTFGDFLALRDVQSEKKTEARMAMMRKLPLVRVQGGDIDVSGSVSIDGGVSIE